MVRAIGIMLLLLLIAGIAAALDHGAPPGEDPYCWEFPEDPECQEEEWADEPPPRDDHEFFDPGDWYDDPVDTATENPLWSALAAAIPTLVGLVTFIVYKKYSGKSGGEDD